MIAAVSAIGCADSTELADRELGVALVDRFGSIDGPLALNPVGAIALSQGNGDTLFVTQFRVPAVLMVSSAGDSLGMLGRAGAGPGEFTIPSAPHILSDTVWISDRGVTVHRFDPNGVLIDQLSFRSGARRIGEPARFAAPLVDGSLLFYLDDAPASEADEDITVRPWIRASRDGQVLDTLLLQAQRNATYMLKVGQSGAFITGAHPANMSDEVETDPLGRWVVSAAPSVTDMQPRVVLRWVNPTGDTIAIQEVSVRQVSSSALLDALANRLARSHQGEPADLRASISEELDWPESEPPIDMMFIDFRGSAWIRTPHAHPDSSRWLVVDREGGILGGFTLPTRVELRTATDTVAWGWTHGAYDEPYLLRFHVGLPER